MNGQALAPSYFEKTKFVVPWELICIDHNKQNN